MKKHSKQTHGRKSKRDGSVRLALLSPRKTIIETIDHSSHRYLTVGDYWVEGDVQKIVVSRIGDPKMEFLIQLHEFIECSLCRFSGIKEPKIKKFDENFEKTRAIGNIDEPGFDSKAPYKRQHTIATAIEMMIAAELGVDWKKYSHIVESL